MIKNYSFFIIAIAIFGTVLCHEGHSHEHAHDEDDDMGIYSLLRNNLHNFTYSSLFEKILISFIPDLSFVTCGSVVKLRHIPTNYRLHSHQVTYGSGSGQQSVTGFPNNDDPNSYWSVRGVHDKRCVTG